MDSAEYAKAAYIPAATSPHTEALKSIYPQVIKRAVPIRERALRGLFEIRIDAKNALSLRFTPIECVNADHIGSLGVAEDDANVILVDLQTYDLKNQIAILITQAGVEGSTGMTYLVLNLPSHMSEPTMPTYYFPSKTRSG